MKAFPYSAGEMAERVRRMDWSKTALGPIEEWPLELRVSVNNLLSNPFPAAIAWGPDLVQIYNDSYTTLLAGKHPRVFGAPTREIWAEVWEQIEPLIEVVLTTGEPFWQEDARFLLEREEGLRESFFTFAYSAIFDRDGKVAGLQVTAAETSASVLIRRRLALMQEISRRVASVERPVEVFHRAAEVFSEHPGDIHFALIYLDEEDKGQAQLLRIVGGQEELDETAATDLPHVQIPISHPSGDPERVQGSIVFGTSPVLPLDDAYRGFLEEIARMLSTTYGTLRAKEERAELLRRRLEQRHLQERAQLLESLDDPFYAMDHDWRITYVNAAASRDPSWPSQDVVGRVVWEMFPALKKTALPEVLARAQATAQTQTVEIHYRPTGRHYRVRIFPWEQGVSVAFRDITAQKAFEEELVTARERAEEMTRIKSSILANMSHEVRTPLTSIIGMATVLSRNVPPEFQDQAEHIERAGKRLADTLEAVLTLARLEGSESGEGSREPVDLAAETREAVNALKSLAHEKKLSLELVAPDEPIIVETNRVYLQSIFNNLIGNAIKFTPRGYVLLRVSTDGGRGIVEVSDTGIGIEADFLPHLFEAFRQGSTGLSRTHGGVGLGLHITWKMVQACGGTLTVLTTPGAGTTFTLALPHHSTSQPST